MLLARALAELEVFTRKYSTLEELDEVKAAVRALERKVKGKVAA